MEILKIENLNFAYGNFWVLKNISFNIKENEFVALIGPNASGKTTLLKIITRILPIKYGKILFLNKEIQKYNIKDYAKYVSFATKISDYSLHYKVEDFLYIARYPWDFKNFEIEFLLEEFELKNIIKKSLNELSSGELQRVLIAQSLAQTPKLLILDEPISHLDISHQIKILDIIKKINIDKKITVLASFHELNLAFEYCDKVIVISNGELKKYGIPENIIDYQIIEEIYKTQVIVKKNPISNKPYVIPIPIMWKKNL